MEVSLSLSLSGAGAVTTLYGEPRHHLRRFELGRTTKLSSSRSSNLHSLRFNSSPSRFTTWVSATGKESEDHLAQNFGEEEDTDEMFDSLFEKYGKVVFQSNDKKSSSDEIDDDSESLSFAVAIAKVASDVKAGDIKVLFVKPLVYWTRFFIITTAFSRPQIDAIRFRVKGLAEKEYGRVSTGDTKPNSWTLLDFGDVVFHIFLPEQREYYNLEEFYANATLVDLPFDKQPPYQR